MPDDHAAERQDFSICLSVSGKEIMGLLERFRSLWLSLSLSLLFATVALHAQAPTPVSVLGHTPGDDFYLADYEDAIKYFHALAASTDRMKMFTVGKSTQ